MEGLIVYTIIMVILLAIAIAQYINNKKNN